VFYIFLESLKLNVPKIVPNKSKIASTEVPQILILKPSKGWYYQVVKITAPYCTGTRGVENIFLHKHTKSIFTYSCYYPGRKET
jgi:hypothetical protein